MAIKEVAMQDEEALNAEEDWGVVLAMLPVAADSVVPSLC